MIFLLFAGLCILLFRFPSLDQQKRDAWIQRWSGWVLRVLGVKIEVTGASASIPSNALIVGNHVSWLDIVVLHSQRSAAFIAKAEIQSWPLVGLLVERSGTIFIERGKRHAVHAVLQTAIQRLGDQRNVAVFPEGTTNNGYELLPFHGNMFEAAVRAHAPVQPIAVVYRDAQAKFPAAMEFVGDTTFVGSLLKVLGCNDIVARVSILPLIETQDKSRHDLAMQSQALIAERLRV